MGFVLDFGLDLLEADADTDKTLSSALDMSPSEAMVLVDKFTESGMCPRGLRCISGRWPNAEAASRYFSDSSLRQRAW